MITPSTGENRPNSTVSLPPLPEIIGTPERAFIVHPALPEREKADLLHCCLSRARSTVQLLMNSHDGEDFGTPSRILLDVLWQISGTLELAQQVLLAGVGAGSHEFTVALEADDFKMVLKLATELKEPTESFLSRLVAERLAELAKIRSL